MKSEQTGHRTFEEVHKEFQALSEEDHQRRVDGLIKWWRRHRGGK